MLFKAGHTIMVATDPRMYNYFPSNNKILRMSMIAGGLFIVSKTPKSLEIMKKVVKCALIEDCMGPPNSTTSCVKNNILKGKYGNCHRFDQSAFALSLAQCSTNINDYLKLSDRVYVSRLRLDNPKIWAAIKKKFPWVTEIII